MLRAASGLVWIGAASAVPTQRRALHPYDHCTPTDPSFAVLCQSIEDTFNFDTPQADKTACEAAGTCTWVPPPESAGYAPEVGSACDTAGMTSHCSNSAGVTGVEACFACVRRYGFAENAGGDCTEEDVNDFCINGNNPCDTFDCGGYAEGHCSPLMSLTDDAAAIAACRAVVQSGGWGSDPDADRLKCNNAGLLQTGRTGTLCEYFPGALRGVCEWAPGDAGPTCRCEEHWRSELGHLGGPCTERCTGNEDASAQTGCRTTALPTNVGEIGDEQGNMFDASIMACVAGEPHSSDPCTTWQRAADVYTPDPEDRNPQKSLYDLDQQFCYEQSNLALGIQCEYVTRASLTADPQQVTCPHEADLQVCAKAQHASVGDCLNCCHQHFGAGSADGGWEFEDCATLWEGFCESSHYGTNHGGH